MSLWRRQQPTQPPAQEPEAAGSGKGRPTPSRKEAEAARRHTLKVPSDPKEARKAAKDRAAQERAVERAARMSGDQAALPKRDKGPVRAFVRDYVDGRVAAAEFFLPIALVVLVVGFLRIQNVQAITSMLWMASMLIIVVDTTILILRMNRELARRWPDKSERKGSTFYALSRVLQVRKLRLPPPRLTMTGKPIAPK